MLLKGFLVVGLNKKTAFVFPQLRLDDNHIGYWGWNKFHGASVVEVVHGAVKEWHFAWIFPVGQFLDGGQPMLLEGRDPFGGFGMQLDAESSAFMWRIKHLQQLDRGAGVGVAKELCLNALPDSILHTAFNDHGHVIQIHDAKISNVVYSYITACKIKVAYPAFPVKISTFG